MKEISEKYRTGIEEVDAEHLVLLELTDRTRKLLEDENMLFKCADIRELLAGLQNYTVVHFTHEEAFMESLGFDGLAEQKQQHRVFEKKLEEFTDRVSRLSLGTQDEMIHDLFEYLQQWLHDHIKNEDMKYAEFASRQAQGDHCREQ